MKNIGIIILYACVGGVFGLLLGMGELNYVKKSQRDSLALVRKNILVGIALHPYYLARHGLPNQGFCCFFIE
jgi:hypothetical protein